MNKIENAEFIRQCQNLSEARLRSLPHVRMGQHFCNKFPWLDEAEPFLFYMTDDGAAAKIIKKYVI